MRFEYYFQGKVTNSYYQQKKGDIIFILIKFVTFVAQ